MMEDVLLGAGIWRVDVDDGVLGDFHVAVVCL